MNRRIDPRIEIGHVHLKVADLERAIRFYTGVLGLELIHRRGQSTAFLGAGGHHHQIVLTTTSDSPPAAHRFAIRYPDRASLGDALRRLREAGAALGGATDDGVSEALHVMDPDGNAIELYRDRSREEWPRGADGSLQMASRTVDVEALLHDATGPQRMTEPRRKQLVDLRFRLLNLHKALLDDARVAYEMDRGSVGSTANLLQLVINDPWFAWLHSVSELIVRIDEMVAADSPAADGDAQTLAEQVEKLLTASETGDGFRRRYFEALQRQPAVVLAHGEVRRTLKSMKS